MAKQLNVNLAFSADTSQALKNLQELQKNLNAIASLDGGKAGAHITSNIKEASSAAKDLQSHIMAAFNTSTGNIDLSKFQASLKASNQSLSSLSTSLLKAGMTGEQSFLQVHKAISSANISLIKSQGLLSQFATTLKNTARWQISSSVLHGFMSSVQSAVRYAEDLNESLNNIRIVTGQNTDQMARFAVEANKAAKALSTTTTEYTNASLIYFQQGLSDQQVKERTDVTIKLAQAAGQSVEMTSDQLTAVWNNFYDGTQTLEHYADAMTKLGAETASSVDEIAGGLEKFASIGNMIGLSFDNAAAALATITATTRQSEEVVGTALKTIFARIQGLSLGETLDDGTNLNKYSQALAAVGIDIKNQAGELKDMDTILAEMGAKWETLAKDQQVALAQTVAGVRQYNQLVSLMDNFDFYEQNLASAQNADGSLQEAADIYAESWEAASDRVRAALEKIYSQLVPEDAAIGFLNVTEDLVTTVGTLVETMGGLKGILLLVSSLAMSKFSPEISRAMDSAIEKVRNLKSDIASVWSGAKGVMAGAKAVASPNSVNDSSAGIKRYEENTQSGISKEAKEYTASLQAAAQTNIPLTAGFSSQVKSLQQINQLNNQIVANRKNLTASEREILQSQLAQAQALSEQVAAAKDVVELAQQEQANLIEKSISDSYGDGTVNFGGDGQGYITPLENQTAQQTKELLEATLGLKAGIVNQTHLQLGDEVAIQSYQSQAIEQIAAEAQLRADLQVISRNELLSDQEKVAAMRELVERTAATEGPAKKLAQSLLGVESSSKNSSSYMNDLNGKIREASRNSAQAARALGISEENIQGAVRNGQKLSSSIADATGKTKQFNQAMDGAQNTLQGALKSSISFTGTFSKMIGSASQVAMSISMVSNAIDQIKDPDVSWVQKLASGTMAASMAVGALGTILNGLNSIFTALNTTQALNTVITKAGMTADQQDTLGKIARAAAIRLSKGATEAETTANVANLIQKKLGVNEDRASALAKYLVAGATKVNAESLKGESGAQVLNTISKKAGTAANYSLAASEYAALGPALLVVAAIAALVAIVWLFVKAVKAAEAASPEGQLKSAKEAADQAAEAFNRVSDSVNATREALAELNEQTDILKGLTVGTEEWYNALTKVNTQVMDLLSKYPELAAMGFITSDENGVMGISEEGQDYINSTENNRLMTSANIRMQAQNDVLLAENKVTAEDMYYKGGYEVMYGQQRDIYDDQGYYIGSGENNLKDNFEQVDEYGYLKDDYFDYDDLATVAGQYYRQAGDSMFADVEGAALDPNITTGAEALAETLYEHDQMTDEQWQAAVEAMQNYLSQNEEGIRSIATNLEQTENINNVLMKNRLTGLGSNRDVDEAVEIINSARDENSQIEGYEDVLASSRADIKKDMGDWNDHINYDNGINGTSDEEWAKIEDFMSLQGENVEYVAQRSGNMVLNVDGTEMEFTEDQFYDQLSEYYAGQELETMLEEGLTNTLSTAIGKSVEGLDLEQLTEIDNFRKGMTDTLLDQGYSEEEADSMFSSTLNAYTADPNSENYTMADFESFQESTQYVDQTSQAFLRQAEALNEGRIKAEDFKAAVAELNAEGQLASMGEYFAEAGGALGLGEEEIVDMQAYAEHIRSLAKDSETFADSLASDAESAADLAVEITRMNKGVEELAEGFGDWKDVLKNSSKESAEFAKAMKSTKTALANVLDVEEDLIDSDFVEEHLEEIEKAAEGDAEAIDFLRSQMDEEIIQDLQIRFPDIADEISTLDQQVKTELDRINTEMPDLEVGAILQDQAFIDAANNLVEQSGMTADEANAYFAGIGYEPVYEQTDVEAPAELPSGRVRTEVESIGWNKADVDLGLFGTHSISLPNVTTRTVPLPEEPEKADAGMSLVSFSGEGKPPQIKGLRKKATGSQNNYSSSNKGGRSPGGGNGGGGGNSNKSSGKPKKSEIVERYKEITDTIDDITNATDKASKAMDRLYGVNRIKAMKQVNSLLEDEIEALESKKQEAEAYLGLNPDDPGYAESDKGKLENLASSMGFSMAYDDEGNISNYDEIMTALFNELSAATPEEGEEISESQQEEIDEIQKRIDKMKEAISQYDETRELIEDLDNEIQDKIYEIQDNNYEMLSYKLELRLEVNADELKEIEFALGMIEDQFYRRAEAAKLLQSTGTVFNYNLNDLSHHKELLDAAYQADQISQADYLEGLKETRDSIYENLEALLDLDDQMMHYYGDTLNMAAEELGFFTSQMERTTSVFDHYLNIMSILGKEKDYEAMGDFLQGRADTIRDQLDVAKKEHEMYKEQEELIRQKLADAQARGDTAAVELHEEELKAAVEATAEAEEKMYSLTADWAQATRDVIEKEMEAISDSLEKALTNGLGFEALMDNFDKLNTRQEEFLTKTNQLYETNKLMRTANKALDETDNKVAKQKLKNFVTETKNLQEKNQLSQYELEIQQAKYDLLLAEIALEEAQNAKATVRLSRDSEGNFGYVYTADEDQVNDAQQAYEDAENSLYNISLEGQQTYTEKYLQAQQEMYNELTALQQAYLSGEITSQSEYELRKDEIINHYYGEGGVLQTYSELYRIAAITDQDAVADNWQKDYAAMTQNTADWQEAVDEYLILIREQMTIMGETSVQVNEDLEGALEDSQTATENLTDASDDLKDEILNQVIPAIDAEIKKVGEQTAAYAAQRQEILNLIAAYQQMLATMSQQISTASVGFDKDIDYSAMMNEYLNSGGAVGDAIYTEMATQRDAKIDWLETQGYDESYWGTRGQATTDKYNSLYGTNDAWFTKDYYSDDEYKKHLNTILGFATGGYTGAWGPEGKLAVLHEKELVLNEKDTENLLSTISFMKDLISMIDTQASLSSLSSMFAVNGTQMHNETLEQVVTIHAEFPNATDHNEIEEAFNNLVNRASQYANRK